MDGEKDLIIVLANYCIGHSGDWQFSGLSYVIIMNIFITIHNQLYSFLEWTEEKYDDIS